MGIRSQDLPQIITELRRRLSRVEGTPSGIPSSIGTAKGDLAVFDGTSWTVEPAGTDGLFLQAASSTPTGVQYSTPPTFRDLSMRDYYLLPTGAIAETVPRSWVGLSSAPNTGTLYLVGLPLSAGDVVSNISFMTSAGGTYTHYWFGLYDQNRVQLATTNDQLTAAWGNNTVKTLPITQVASGAASSYTIPTTGLYYIGVMMAGAGFTLFATPSVSATLAGVAPVLVGSSDAGQTTVPAFPHTANALTGTVSVYYGYVS